MHPVRLPYNQLPAETADEKKLLNSIEETHTPDDVHIVEFINWKGYTVCNVNIKGVWRSSSFPASTTIIEFLMDGMINQCIHWPQGRFYTNQ